MTTAVIVVMVTTLNIRVTSSTPTRLCFAAGYIRRGMSGSQGPSTKIMNSIQGVMLAWFWSWTWACAPV